MLALSNTYSQCRKCGVHRTAIKPHPLNQPVNMYISKTGRFISCDDEDRPPLCIQKAVQCQKAR